MISFEINFAMMKFYKLFSDPRYKYFLLLICAIIPASCKNKPNTSIEGNFRSAENKVLMLEYLNINQSELIDSLGIKRNGNFKFKIFVDQPGIYTLRNENGKIINLLISAGEKLTVKGGYNEFDKDYSVVGSPDSEFLRLLAQKLSDTRNQLKLLDETYKKATNPDEFQTNEYLIRRNGIIKNQRDYSISFIIGHLSSLASIYALYQKFTPQELVLNENRDIQYMKIVADTLSVKYPNSVFVSTFVNDARSAEKRYSNLIGLNKKIQEAHTGMPDIKYPDIKGNIRSLSSLKGKTVLLYFWSVYSDPDDKLNPAIEKIYRKYKNKGFEVFAVCIDKNSENWLKMINYDELSYINMLGSDFPDSEAAHAYNLRTIPSTYLIDKEGNIIARDIYGIELEKWLENRL